MPEAAELKYGTPAWLEDRFRHSEGDPWGLCWRATEQHRYDCVLTLARRCLPANLLQTRQAAILDVGCATGNFTRRLATLSDRVLGIDLSETAIARARLSSSDVSYLQAGVSDPVIHEASFDFITCLEVLYYVDSGAQEAFVQAMGRAMKPGTQAVVSSVIGPRPYFQPEQFAALLRTCFAIKTTEFYGSAAWARQEGRMYRFTVRLARLRQWFALGSAAAVPEIERIQRPSSRRTAQTLVRCASRNAVTRRALDIVLSLPFVLTRAIVRARLPARLANGLAARFSLRRTHTLVVVERK